MRWALRVPQLHRGAPREKKVSKQLHYDGMIAGVSTNHKQNAPLTFRSSHRIESLATQRSLPFVFQKCVFILSTPLLRCIYG